MNTTFCILFPSDHLDQIQTWNKIIFFIFKQNLNVCQEWWRSVNYDFFYSGLFFILVFNYAEYYFSIFYEYFCSLSSTVSNRNLLPQSFISPRQFHSTWNNITEIFLGIFRQLVERAQVQLITELTVTHLFKPGPH